MAGDGLETSLQPETSGQDELAVSQDAPTTTTTELCLSQSPPLNTDDNSQLPSPTASSLNLPSDQQDATSSNPSGPVTSTYDPLKPSTIVPNPLVDEYDCQSLDSGVLIPLKTTLEIRQDYSIVQAWITRVPSKNTNEFLTVLSELLPEDKLKGLTHMRRCAKPGDLPVHLKTQFMNDTAAGRLAHTGKANYMYIIVCLTTDLEREKIGQRLQLIEGVAPDIFLEAIPVPLNPPTSQVQAAMWTAQFWPTMYRKNNPLGPHPSMVSRATDEIRGDTALWMKIAHRVADKSKAMGIGEAMGAVIIQRWEGKVKIIAAAGDARWHNQIFPSKAGNPIAHCAMRAISMVAQKLVRHEKRTVGDELPNHQLQFDAFQDEPILEEEKIVFEEEHPSPDGYLCHGLELYLTHEPCIQCSMAILHSRVGKVVFGHRMPMTGGLCSEDRGHGYPELAGCNAGHGLGLFWRRELNWSMLGWEWEPGEGVKELPPLPYEVHA